MRANSASELTSETPTLEQRGQRAEQAALQRGERDEGADRQRGAGQPGAEVDHRRDGGEDHAGGRHAPATGELRAQLQVDQACGRGGEAVDQRGPGAQRAGELRAVDREAFLDRDVEVGQLPLLRRGDLAAHPRDPARQPDRRGEHDERDQREPPGQRDHRDRRGDRGGQVGRDRGRRAGDDRLQAPDVVGDAGLDLAGAGLGEERDRLALQVGEDVGAQAVHHLLPDAGARPGLHDAEGGGQRGDGDHAAREHGEQGQVAVRQRGVDHGAEQERRGHAEHGRGDDDRGDARDRAPVGEEEAADAAQRDAAGLRLLGGGDGADAGCVDVGGAKGAPVDGGSSIQRLPHNEVGCQHGRNGRAARRGVLGVEPQVAGHGAGGVGRVGRHAVAGQGVGGAAARRAAAAGRAGRAPADRAAVGHGGGRRAGRARARRAAGPIRRTGARRSWRSPRRARRCPRRSVRRARPARAACSRDCLRPTTPSWPASWPTCAPRPTPRRPCPPPE